MTEIEKLEIYLDALYEVRDMIVESIMQKTRELNDKDEVFNKEVKND